MALKKSTLPLRLEGLLTTDNAQQKQAMIRHIESGAQHQYRQDDAILDNVFLVLIEKDRVVLENQGKLEFLPLAGDPGSGLVAAMTDQPPTSAGASARVAASMMPTGMNDDGTESLYEKARNMPGLGYKPRPVVAAKGETPLSRQWIEQQLQREQALRSHFQEASHEVEGVNLLKLKDTSQNEFYQTLGLQDGDVVMLVDNEWVHEAQNNLFRALRDKQEVSLVLMRKGLPVHLKYAIN